MDSINIILSYFEELKIHGKPLEKMAYMFATIRHEVGADMVPIQENLNYSAQRLVKVWPSRFPSIRYATEYANNPNKLADRVYDGRLGNGKGEGYKYRGRGYIQLTGRVNYEKFAKLTNLDLINDPDLALYPEAGIFILSLGMDKGLFTGKKLRDYINTKKIDYYNARSIVNSDKGRVGNKIAKDANKFEKILNYALQKDEDVV